MFRLNLFPLLTLAAIAFAVPAAARAALQVTLEANGVEKTIVDGGAGDFDALINNKIKIILETVGGYEFSFTASLTNSPGIDDAAQLEVSTSTIEYVGGGGFLANTTVSLTASANDFVQPTGVGLVSVSGATMQYLTGSTPGGTATVSYGAFTNTDNLLKANAVGVNVGNGGPELITATGGNANQSDFVFLGPQVGPYGVHLEIAAIINSNVATRFDLDGQVEITSPSSSLYPLPEPTSMVIWGLGAIGLGIAGYRRRNRVTA